MSEYIDEVFDGLKSIQAISEELDMFADAFGVTGNERLESDIGAAASGLRAAEGRIRRAVAKETTRQAGAT